MFDRLKNEAGYSLVEVMASIVILTIAIIPMIAMFDMGLNTATEGSNYDKARSLANKQLERAKNLSYTDVRDNFPGTTNTPYDASGKYEILAQTDPDPEYSNFTYDILKEYVELVADPLDPDPDTLEFEPTGNNADSKMLRITVTVKWDGAGDCDDTTRCYTTNGVVAE